MNDLISRQAAIDSIRECVEAVHDNYESDMEQGYLNAIECIEKLPSAGLEKHAKWISFGEYKMGRYAGWICSNCETFFDDSKANLYIRCPKCGAYMEE